MANQLIPPAEFAADDLGKLSPVERISVWLALLDDGHKLVMAGLEREHGSHAQEAYRNLYAEQMEEHDRVTARFLERLNRRRKKHAS